MRLASTMLILIAASGASAGWAQGAGSPNSLVDGVVACRGQTDPAARLACYDAAATALDQATTQGAIVVVDREEVRKTRRSLFGFSIPKLPFFNGDDSQAEAPEEIEATIRSVRALNHGKFVFELDSGARWQTTESDTRPPDPKAGDSITIKKGTLGGYFLTVAGSRAVRGMRVG